jgi:hypothetical protein
MEYTLVQFQASDWVQASPLQEQHPLGWGGGGGWDYCREDPMELMLEGFSKA